MGTHVSKQKTKTKHESDDFEDTGEIYEDVQDTFIYMNTLTEINCIYNKNTLLTYIDICT